MQDPAAELLRSKSFLEWSPDSVAKPSTGSIGRAPHIYKSKPHIYKSKRVTNLIVDEKHYAPADLAKAWNVDVETIRNVFRDEPGVVKIGDKNPRHKRPYLTLRIPESVAVRVHRRLSE